MVEDARRVERKKVRGINMKIKEKDNEREVMNCSNVKASAVKCSKKRQKN